MDQNNYNLGHYLKFAFNDPSKYPKKPFFESITNEKPKLSAPMSDEDMEKMMIRNTKLLGGKFIK